MRKKILLLALVLGLLMNVSLVQNVRGMTVVSESFIFSGFGGWTMYSVSSAPVQHRLRLFGLNGSITVYVLDSAYSAGDEPTEYLYRFTGTEINEVMTIAAPIVSIVMFSSSYITGSVLWEADVGFPDDGMTVLIWVIILVSLGVGLFAVYKILRWRKLKD